MQQTALDIWAVQNNGWGNFTLLLLIFCTWSFHTVIVGILSLEKYHGILIDWERSNNILGRERKLYAQLVKNASSMRVCIHEVIRACNRFFLLLFTVMIERGRREQSGFLSFTSAFKVINNHAATAWYLYCHAHRWYWTEPCERNHIVPYY